MNFSYYHTLRSGGFLIVGLGLAFVGCRSPNYLASYDFRNSTLGVVTAIPPRPEVFTEDFFDIDPNRPLRTVLRVGSSVVKEVEAEKARVKLDSAMRRVDVADRISIQALERSTVYLRAYPTDAIEEADFLLDVRVWEYGIDASAWDAQAYFMINAEVLLIDPETGRRIWRAGAEGRDPITPAIFGPGTAEARNLVTAAAFARLSVDEMVIALEHLADFAATELAYRLQRDLDRASG